MAVAAPVWNSAGLLEAAGASELRIWCEEAEELERRNAELVEQLRQGEHVLREARSEAAEVRAQQETLTGELPAAQRAKRITQKRNADVEAELHAEQEGRLRRERDNHGLRRTLTRLRRRLEDAVEVLSQEEATVAETADLKEAAMIEASCLAQTISGMGDVGKKLEQRVAHERERRLQLKACIRSRLQKLEEVRLHQGQQVKEHEADMEDWKRRVAAQEARTQVALAELATCRGAAERARAYLQRQREARMAMHRELLEVQRAHEQLRENLADTLAQVSERNRQQDEARKEWRLRYLEKVDARTSARRCMDHDIVVADCTEPEKAA